jgi:hypothetical protein
MWVAASSRRQIELGEEGASMRRQVWFILLGILFMLSGYQNCSNSMSFDGEKISSKAAVDNTTDESNRAMLVDPNAVPPSSQSSDDDDDTEIDYDYNGRKLAFNCFTGARLRWNDAALLAAPDLELKNKSGFSFRYLHPLRNVTIENVQGSIYIKNAHTVSDLDSVRGLMSFVRAVNVEKARHIEAGVSAVASMNLKELSHIKAAYTCASAQTFGQISNIMGAYIKLRGRSDGHVAGSNLNSSSFQNNGKANEISDIKAAFTSIYRLNTTWIHNIEGELIIRNSRVERLENVKGGITLINSSVGLLKNVEGVVRTKNSKIENEENILADRIPLK